MPSAPMIRRSPWLSVMVLAAAVWFGACRTAGGPADIRLGVEASQDGRWDEAVERWTRAAASNPASAAAHNNLAVALERLSRFDEARTEYETALKLAPADARIQENYRRFQEARRAAAGLAGQARSKEPRGEK